MKYNQDKRCCGRCKHHQKDYKCPDHEETWYCINERSEYNATETPYNHTCEDWEER